ncbi:MAG TPA: hypothetical protein VKF81_17475 [Blastocatellia bacterium]|nr:hypothetical protein [Blastocatellia bacterium]
MVEKPSKIQPALLGGLVIGLGSVIPGLSYGNLCCCGWAIAGGALAAYLLKRRSPILPITSGEGAGAGVLAGVVGSFIYLVLGVPLALLQWNNVVGQMNQRSDSFSDPASREMFRQIVGTMQDHPILISLAGWLVFTVVGIGAAAIGGVIGVALFEKRKGQRYPHQPPPPTGFTPGYGPTGQAPREGMESR